VLLNDISGLRAHGKRLAANMKSGRAVMLEIYKEGVAEEVEDEVKRIFADES